ncbi:NADPH:quinone reductase [Xanthomonas campestris pv. leeana]|uniref:NADP-dependent oxidoreductase n=1 Tax=Xanthomonas citri TaxID=346 RepID=UPI0002986CD7|nr:NADP-dependent oxidoreductase [Xanthomonas citri]EKQ62715.1 alcohol dehydrogenase zinc-binding domain-containing protein [Xanthomonas citri pv. malvacearum str. GSPB2388]OOW65486.1 NADPH:quinone reductase [Xanthomonas campestris pv. thespesiae]OOW77675.1 NADPH:quinone reductase [Xanthomonas campestris pv. leeana]
MKAVQIHAYNDTPTIEDVLTPDIGDDDILVRVHAAALNPLDALVVSGLAARFFTIELPLTLATDFAGTVERVGASVSQWKPGDAVIGWADAGTSGGLAEFAKLPATSAVALPPQLSAAQGAAIPTAGSTAWHALFSVANLQAGETVLIHGAAGGVGTYAVQFAHKAGARVIATASGDGLDLVRKLGAVDAIDYKTQDFTHLVSNVDVVLDLVGGETQARSYAVLRKGGRLVSTVAAAPIDEAAAQAHGVNASIIYAKPYASRLNEVVAFVAEQDIDAVFDRRLPLAQFNEAWERLTSRRARGKVVLSLV